MRNEIYLYTCKVVFCKKCYLNYALKIKCMGTVVEVYTQHTSGDKGGVTLVD